MNSNFDFKKMHNQFKSLEKDIIAFNNIVIYRHSSPDFDALGSQMGLYTWIKDNFPNKEVHFVGDNINTLMPFIYPISEEVPESFFEKEHLAITVDVSDLPRVSKEKLKFAKKLIKIDHHPLPPIEKQFGDDLIVYPEMAACAELLSLFVLSRSRKRTLSKEAATYLYSGIVGDTNRFLYQDTSSMTLRLAASLLDAGVNKDDVYFKMYQSDERRMNILKFVLNNYKITSGHVCYFVFTNDDMKKLDMTIDEGNLHINTFRNLKGVEAVVSVTEDENKGYFRVSIRSSRKPISEVAKNYDGGGHDFAAGCKLYDLAKLDNLIHDLEEIVKE